MFLQEAINHEVEALSSTSLARMILFKTNLSPLLDGRAVGKIDFEFFSRHDACGRRGSP